MRVQTVAQEVLRVAARLLNAQLANHRHYFGRQEAAAVDVRKDADGTWSTSCLKCGRSLIFNGSAVLGSARSQHCR